MEENISLSDIKETGYNTWRDFYFHQTSYSAVNEVHTFEYTNPENQKNTVNLPFGRSILKMLVLEESKLLLRYLNIKSFTELLEHKNNLVQGNFDFNVVIIGEDEHVSYKKISISLHDAVCLSDIEKFNYPYVVYEKNTKWSSF